MVSKKLVFLAAAKLDGFMSSHDYPPPPPRSQKLCAPSLVTITPQEQIRGGNAIGKIIASPSSKDTKNNNNSKGTIEGGIRLRTTNKNETSSSEILSAVAPPPKPTKPASKDIVAGKLPPCANGTRASSAKRALPGTRKPRGGGSNKRSKREQVDNRSTVTSTTDAIKTPVNVYDAVLGEAEDLLQAASEAQALGRLKMASAYQLLLHARLVGLGKRFDRASVEESSSSSSANNNKNGKNSDGTTPVNGTRSARVSLDTRMNATTAIEKTATTKKKAKVTTPATPQPISRVNTITRPTNVQELSKFLPEHIELDSAMIEHLARAAIDLHHKRTGRKIQSSSADGTTVSSNGSSNAKTKSTVAWTEEEKLQCEELLRQGLSEERISQRMKSRTETQVRSYLQNQKQRQSQVRAVEQVFVGGGDTPKKSKGRGRKPPTQAMNTVPNANLNAKELLSGNVLKHTRS